MIRRLSSPDTEIEHSPSLRLEVRARGSLYRFKVATLVRDDSQGSASYASEQIWTSCAVRPLMDSHKSSTADSRSRWPGRFRTRKTRGLRLRTPVFVGWRSVILRKDPRTETILEWAVQSFYGRVPLQARDADRIGLCDRIAEAERHGVSRSTGEANSQG